jgi:hypothetical protein
MATDTAPVNVKIYVQYGTSSSIPLKIYIIRSIYGIRIMLNISVIPILRESYITSSLQHHAATPGAV